MTDMGILDGHRASSRCIEENLNAMWIGPLAEIDDRYRRPTVYRDRVMIDPVRYAVGLKEFAHLI